MTTVQAETLEANPTAGRQVLRRLLVGPDHGDPEGRGRTLFFNFSGTSSYAEYASGDDGKCDLAIGAPAIRVVSRNIAGQVAHCRSAVSGMWCPRGDSNTRHAV